MKQDDIEAGKISQHAEGLGTVTWDMVRKRAQEIAIISGRTPRTVLPSDFQQARRELTGDEGLVPIPTAEENLPVAERWDPNRGSAGRMEHRVLPHDEQTDTEHLYEEGMAEAEHDQMLEATREQRRLRK